MASFKLEQYNGKEITFDGLWAKDLSDYDIETVYELLNEAIKIVDKELFKRHKK